MVIPTVPSTWSLAGSGRTCSCLFCLGFFQEQSQTICARVRFMNSPVRPVAVARCFAAYDGWSVPTVMLHDADVVTMMMMMMILILCARKDTGSSRIRSCCCYGCRRRGHRSRRENSLCCHGDTVVATSVTSIRTTIVNFTMRA